MKIEARDLYVGDRIRYASGMVIEIDVRVEPVFIEGTHCIVREGMVRFHDVVHPETGGSFSFDQSGEVEEVIRKP